MGFNSGLKGLTVTLPHLHVSLHAGHPPLCIYNILLHVCTLVRLSETRVWPNVNRKVCCTVDGFISKQQFNLLYVDVVSQNRYVV
jgi:hypothetical protein